MKEKGTIAMEGEGSIEYQDLQQILDNFAKEQEEKGNKNTPTTTMVALPIWDNISNALDQWLQSISLLEERQRKVRDLRERINRKLEQVQQDGLISIYDFGTLTYIGQVWIDLINLLSSFTDATIMDKGVKQLILENLFQLYNMQQISYELIMKIILQL
jgi:hypothetical protein